MAQSVDPLEQAKERAGRHAAAYVEDGMRVGLGTGSTVHFTILALGERKARITCAATSERTWKLATSLGLTVFPPDELGTLDLAVDGADEVDPRLNLIKGGGGAHTREKIIAEMARRFVVVVDESKRVKTLGARAVPLEVLPFAPGAVEEKVKSLGAIRVSRRAGHSDNGNLLMDAQFPPIEHPRELATGLSQIPGLVEHGIFLGEMVERVVVASAEGVHELTRED